MQRKKTENKKIIYIKFSIKLKNNYHIHISYILLPMYIFLILIDRNYFI